MKFSVKNLVQGYGNNIVLDNISFEVDSGEVVSILGPNGSGKSTLIKTICNILKPMSGSVLIDDVPINKIAKNDFAKKVAYVPQSTITFGYNSVYDTVIAGRRPYIQWSYSKKDVEMAADAMRRLHIDHLHDQYLSDVSGGQKQRAHIARALVQDSEFFILDEPTSALDLKHQIETMTIMRDLTREENKTAIIAVHDLNLALNYSDRVIVLKDSKVYADGAPTDVITSDMLESVYNVRADVESKGSGTFIHPYGTTGVGEVDYLN